MRPHPLPLPLMALLVASGCGSRDEVTVSELVDRLAAIQCQKLFACCNPAELMEAIDGSDPPIETEEDCHDFYGGF